MVRKKERHLLVRVELLECDGVGGGGGGGEGPHLSALHASIREVALRRLEAANDVASLKASLQTRFYVPCAQACLVRVPLRFSTAVRASIPHVRFAHRHSLRLTVLRAYGNVVLARRALARRIDQSLEDVPEAQRTVSSPPPASLAANMIWTVEWACGQAAGWAIRGKLCTSKPSP